MREPPDRVEARRIAQVYGEYERAEYASGKWSERNKGNAVILRQRRNLTERIIATWVMHPVHALDILEIGCGEGQVISELLRMGCDPSRVVGVDILEDRIRNARAALPGVRFFVMDASALAFPDRSFDLVVMFTMMSSVLDEEIRRRIAGEIRRVLRPSGAVLWYDMRVKNPSNRNVRGVSRRMLATLFPGYELHTRSLTLVPPLARRLGPFTAVLYPVLDSLPFLRTHLIGVLVKSEP